MSSKGTEYVTRFMSFAPVAHCKYSASRSIGSGDRISTTYALPTREAERMRCLSSVASGPKVGPTSANQHSRACPRTVFAQCCEDHRGSAV